MITQCIRQQADAAMFHIDGGDPHIYHRQGGALYTFLHTEPAEV